MTSCCLSIHNPAREYLASPASSCCIHREPGINGSALSQSLLNLSFALRTLDTHPATTIVGASDIRLCCIAHLREMQAAIAKPGQAPEGIGP